MLHATELHNWLVWAIAVAGTLLVLVLATFAVWRHKSAVERHTRHILANISDRLLRDVALPDGIGGWVVIDAVMLRGQNVYVLDLRDIEGAIFGAEKMDNWTIIGRHWRSQFQNPLRFMHDRVLAVRTLLPELQVSGHVLFSERANFPKGRPEGVQLLEEFAKPLMRHKSKKPVALESQTEEVWQRLCDTAEIVTQTQRSRATTKPASAQS